MLYWSRKTKNVLMTYANIEIMTLVPVVFVLFLSLQFARQSLLLLNGFFILKLM